MVFGTLERAIAWSLTNPLFMLLKFYLMYLAKEMMIDSFFSFDGFCIREYIEGSIIKNMHVFHLIFIVAIVQKLCQSK